MHARFLTGGQCFRKMFVKICDVGKVETYITGEGVGEKPPAAGKLRIILAKLRLSEIFFFFE